MKRTVLIIVVMLNLTGCMSQRIWFWDTVADALDPHPQIEKVAE